MEQSSQIIRSRYYNPTDSQIRQQLQSALDLGHTIACASRPIPGEATWTGEWCGGIHWATGYLNEHRKIWVYLDAAIIELVDNNKLLQIAQENYNIRMEDPHYARLYAGTCPTWAKACQRYSEQDIVASLVPNAPWKWIGTKSTND